MGRKPNEIRKQSIKGLAQNIPGRKSSEWIYNSQDMEGT